MTPTAAARSFLFVPGDRPDRFAKADACGAEAVILDLEDSVTAERKPQARENICAWLSPGHPAYVRVNGQRTDWFADDIAAVAARPGLRGIVLPKADDPKRLAEIAAQLPAGVPLIPIIESAAAVWHVRAIAAVTGVERLALGSMDLALELGIDGQPEQLLYTRSRMVLAAHAAGILPPLDGVTVAIEDLEQLRADVEHARRLGFGGKLCIHPKQVAIVNEGFRPPAAQVAWARRVLAAAEAAGHGAFRLDGEMIDRPAIDRARLILDRAR